MPIADTIQEVVDILNQIIAQSQQQPSRLGYFACLYRKMTIAVQKGIQNGLFEDSSRMEKLDVIFANRYFEAYYQYQQNKSCTQSWQFAFTAASKQYTCLQHLLLGINAHINLDLGIAAAQTSQGKNIQLLQKDFNKINEIIGGLINEVQSDLEAICWPFKLVRFIDNESKNAVINFSMKIARDTAWANAVALSILPSESWNGHIAAVDKKIVQVAQNICNPKFSESIVLKTAQLFEPKNVRIIINSLYD